MSSPVWDRRRRRTRIRMLSRWALKGKSATYRTRVTFWVQR